MKGWDKYVIAGDFHYPYHDKRLLKLFLAFLKDFKPDTLILPGDGFDFYQLSSFGKSPERLTTLQNEIDGWVNVLELFAPLARRKEYLEGNHCFRLRRYLINKAPELSSLRSLTVEEQFSLNKLGWRYQRCPSPDKFIHNYMKIGPELWVGHFDACSEISTFTARKLVEKFHISIIQAHTHKGGDYFKRNSRGFLRGTENFCLCDLEASYDAYPNWQHGWTVVMKKRNDARFQVIPINVTNYGFFFGNTEYKG